MKQLAIGLEQIKREDPVHYSVEETKFYGNLIINSLVAAGEHRITQIYPYICVPTFNFSTEFFSFRSDFMWRTSNTNIGMQFPTVDECCCCELKSPTHRGAPCGESSIFFEKMLHKHVV